MEHTQGLLNFLDRMAADDEALRRRVVSLVEEEADGNLRVFSETTGCNYRKLQRFLSKEAATLDWKELARLLVGIPGLSCFWLLFGMGERRGTFSVDALVHVDVYAKQLVERSLLSKRKEKSPGHK